MRGIEDAGFQTHGTARGDGEHQVGHGFIGRHVLHDAACGTHNLDSLARVIIGDIDRGLLDRLEFVAGLVGLVNNLRTADLELEALAAHGFHQHRQMQDAAACHFDTRLVFGLLDTHGDVALLFAHQALFKLTCADDIALAADERAGRGLEHDRHGGFLDLDGFHLNRVLRIGDHVSDVGIFNADHRDDIARMRFGHLGFAKILKGVHLADLGLVGASVGFIDQHLLLLVHRAAMKAANTDTALVAAVIDGAHLQRNGAIGLNVGAGDFLQNGVEQGNHVHVVVVRVVARVAVDGRSVHHGEIELLVRSTQFDHQIENLVNRTIRVGIGTVDLVDHHDDAKTLLERMRKNEARLRLGPLVGIDDKQGAVRHVQDALNLSTEIGMAGRIDDVDLNVLVVDGDILGKNGDTALALLVIRVKNTLLHFLIIAEHVRCPQQAVNKCRFTMIDMSDDGDVAKILLLHVRNYSSSSSRAILRSSSFSSAICSLRVVIDLCDDTTWTIPHTAAVDAMAAITPNNPNGLRAQNRATSPPMTAMAKPLRRSSYATSR